MGSRTEERGRNCINKSVARLTKCVTKCDSTTFWLRRTSADTHRGDGPLPGRSDRERWTKVWRFCLNILNNVLLVPMSSVIHGRSRLRGMDVLEGVIKSFENCRCEASTSRHFNFTLLQDSLILSNLGNFAWKGKVSTRGLEGCRWQGCASSQLLRCSLAASDQCNELVLPFVSWIRWNRLQK